MILTVVLTGCVSEIIRSNDDRYLRPGALDPEVRQAFKRYEYKLMNKYMVGHDWLMGVYSCHYNQPIFDPNAPLTIAGDIDEKDGVTYQLRDSPAYRRTGNIKYLSIDRYVRPEYTVIDVDGKHRTAKGFEPMCNQVWVGTGLALTILMVKSTPEDWEPRLSAWAGNMPRQLGKEQVGNNLWQVQRVPMRSNGVWSVEDWMLPIGDTGYMFLFIFSADKDRVAAAPSAHSQMQEIFRHLIESVRIEPIQPQSMQSMGSQSMQSMGSGLALSHFTMLSLRHGATP